MLIEMNMNTSPVALPPALEVLRHGGLVAALLLFLYHMYVNHVLFVVDKEQYPVS